MAALTSKRASRAFTAITLALPGKTEQVFQGGIACWDTSTGLVAKAFASTTLKPIGKFVEDQNTAAGADVLVELNKELNARWYTNSSGDAVVATSLGSLVYLEDDNTVALTDNTNALSIAGIAWRLDANKGVLVEFRNQADNTNVGLDV